MTRCPALRVIIILLPLLTHCSVGSSACTPGGTDTTSARPGFLDGLTTRLTLASALYSGNINSLDLRTDLSMSKKDSVTELSFFGRTIFTQVDGQVRNREYYGGVKLDLLPDDVWSPFLMATVFANPYKGYDLRISGLAGVKRLLLRRGTMEYSISAALVADAEAYAASSGRADRGMLRLSIRPKLHLPLGDAACIDHMTFVKVSTASIGDVLVDMTTTLHIHASSLLSVDVTHQFDYNNHPPEGRIHRTDHALTAGVTLRW